MKATLVAVALVLGSGAVHGADSGTLPVYGPGNMSCGTWVTARKQNPDGTIVLILRSWVDGFLTNANAYRPNMSETDGAGVDVFLDNYCQAHPTDHVYQGAVELVRTLHGR